MHDVLIAIHKLPVAVTVHTASLCAFSVRINERKHRGVADNKKMAYLVDLKTIAISKCAGTQACCCLLIAYCDMFASFYDMFECYCLPEFPLTELIVMFQYLCFLKLPLCVCSGPDVWYDNWISQS